MNKFCCIIELFSLYNKYICHNSRSIIIGSIFVSVLSQDGHHLTRQENGQVNPKY